MFSMNNYESKYITYLSEGGSCLNRIGVHPSKSRARANSPGSGSARSGAGAAPRRNSEWISASPAQPEQPPAAVGLPGPPARDRGALCAPLYRMAPGPRGLGTS